MYVYVYMKNSPGYLWTIKITPLYIFSLKAAHDSSYSNFLFLNFKCLSFCITFDIVFLFIFMFSMYILLTSDYFYVCIRNKFSVLGIENEQVQSLYSLVLLIASCVCVVLLCFCHILPSYIITIHVDMVTSQV